MAASKTSTTIVKSTAKTSSTSTSKTTISDLPELPLLTIFDFIPLPDLLHIDEVCRAWQGLKPAALRRRRHLIIANDPADLKQLAEPGFDSKDSLMQLILEDDGTPLVRLKVRLDRHALFIGHDRTLRSATLDRLIELLPNLKVFRYVQHYGCCEELWKVKHLLTHYRQQLVEVSICFQGALSGAQRSLVEVQRAFRAMFISLLTSLNRLSELRSLELSFRAAPGCSVDLDDHQLPANCLPDLVGRLTHLKFNTRSEFDGANESDHYVSDARLLRAVLFRMRDEKSGGGSSAEKAVLQSSVGLKSKPQQQQQLQPKVPEDLELYVDSTPLTLKTLILLGPGPVAAGLRTVEIDGMFSGDSAAEYKALARLARQSPHLQALTVGLKCLGIRRLVESLSSLKELLYLSISCAANNPPAEAVNARRPLPALPSVRSMRLTFPALSHHDYEQLHLEVLFPNLRTVLWNHMGWGCPDCGYLIPEEDYLAHYRGDYTVRPDARQFQVAYGRQMSTCVRLARLAAFSRLRHLTHLYLTVRPSQVYLPFKDQMFTNCRLSLGRRAEFVELYTESPNSSEAVVVYND